MGMQISGPPWVVSIDPPLKNALQKPFLTMSMMGDSISTRDQPQTLSGLNGPRADGIGYLLQVL